VAWIEAHQELARHPKVRKAARALGVPKAQLIGHLFMLWWWALDFAPDGAIHDLDDIADAMELDRDDEPGTFIDCLIDFGFIDVDADHGTYVIHDWHEYAGKTAKARDEAKRAGEYGNHVRWHKSEPSPSCPFCRGESPPESPPSRPPIGGASRTAQHSTEQDKTAAAGPSYQQLVEIAETIVAEREADGYDVKNRDALVRSIARSDEAKHRWFKAQAPADMAWTGIGGDL